MNNRRICQQRAERFEFAFPRSSQLIQQCVGLRSSQLKLLKEVQQAARVINRDSNNIYLIGQSNHNLYAKLTTPWQADRFSEFTAATKDLVSNEYRSSALKPPRDARM